MAKRMITTDIFKDAWFMDLPNKYKLFWIFLITDCDYCGIWQVNYKTANFYVGDHLEPGECERFLKDRIVKIEDGKYWFIPKFIDFQYGYELKTTNKPVKKVIDKIIFYDLLEYLPKTKIIEAPTKPLPSPYGGTKEEEEEEEEEEVKDKDKTKGIKESWNIFAKNQGLAEIRGMTKGRAQKLKTRFKEKNFDFPQVLKKIENTDFLLGNNERNWKVDFDFVVASEENYLKILEGKYRNNGNGKNEIRELCK